MHDVAKQLLKLTKSRMTATSTRTAPLFQYGNTIYLSTKDFHIRLHKYKQNIYQRLGSYTFVSKDDITSYKLLLPNGCRIHLVFHCDFLSHDSSSTSLRPRHADKSGDHEECLVGLF